MVKETKKKVEKKADKAEKVLLPPLSFPPYFLFPKLVIGVSWPRRHDYRR